jgi:hypothetical protein
VTVHTGNVVVNRAQPSEVWGRRCHEYLIKGAIADDMNSFLSCSKSIDGLFESLGGLIQGGKGASAETVIITIFREGTGFVTPAAGVDGGAKDQYGIKLFHRGDQSFTFCVI